MKKFIFAANWKMNKTPKESQEFVEEFSSQLDPKLQNQVILLAPALSLSTLRESLEGTQIGLGAQNCFYEKSGAFTGENSPWVLSEMGVQFVLIGHSERRSLFHEDDELLAKKMKAAESFQLTSILCVGENLTEREQNKTLEVIELQLRNALQEHSKKANFILAYEPIWAIGTGKVANPGQANEAQKHLKSVLEDVLGSVAEDVPVLYGGSVNSKNAKELSLEPSIDGFLIGGASLEPSSLLDIVNSVKA